MLVALGVLAADGLWVVRTRHIKELELAELALQQTPRAETAAAVSRAAALRSANAVFTTQVAGVTTVTGRVSEELKPQLVAFTMTTFGGADQFRVSEVVADSVVYLRAPDLPDAPGKPWISVPVAGLAAEPALIGLYQAGAIPTADAALMGSALAVRSAGRQTIDGVRTTRYVGTIDPALALRRLSPALRQLLAPELTAISGNMHYAAWIDGHHDLVRLQTSATIDGSSTVTTVVVTALNKTVHITAPAASQVSAVTSGGDVAASR